MVENSQAELVPPIRERRPAGHPVACESWYPASAGDLPLRVFLVQFDAGQFTVDLYRTSLIACPPHIAAAVCKRQAEYFFGRLCARTALQELNCAQVDIHTGSMREPLWPPGVIGSITHSRTTAAAIVLPASRYRGVGIDIEEIAVPEAHQAILATVVSGNERRIMVGAQGIDSAILLTAVFSAKESFFKALFGNVGRYLDFDAIELEQIDYIAGIFSFRVREALCTGWAAGQCCEIRFFVLPNNQIATLFVW